MLSITTNRTYDWIIQQHVIYEHVNSSNITLQKELSLAAVLTIHFFLPQDARKGSKVGGKPQLTALHSHGNGPRRG